MEEQQANQSGMEDAVNKETDNEVAKATEEKEQDNNGLTEVKDANAAGLGAIGKSDEDLLARKNNNKGESNKPVY